MILNNEEMMNVYGGGMTKLAALLGAGIVFLIGLVDGIVNPRACNK